MTINIRNIPWSIFTQYCVTMTEFLVAYLAQHQKLALWIVDEKHPMPSAPGFFSSKVQVDHNIFRYYLRQYRIDTYSLHYDRSLHLNGPTVSLSSSLSGGRHCCTVRMARCLYNHNSNSCFFLILLCCLLLMMIVVVILLYYYRLIIISIIIISYFINIFLFIIVSCCCKI